MPQTRSAPPPLPTAAPCNTIVGLMIREAVKAERDRRGWSMLKLSQESGVPYSRLHEWLNGNTIHSDHLESLMRVLGLRVCRGKAPDPAPKRKRAKK